MHILLLFGLGGARRMAADHWTQGTVTESKTCWWHKVNTKPARKHALDGAVFPHIITFQYAVDGKPYQGKRYVPPRYAAGFDASPKPGDGIRVWYDPDRPERYAVQV